MAEDNEEKKSEEQVEKKETTVKHGNPFSAAFKGTLGKGCGCLALIILFFVGLAFLTSLGKSSKKSGEPKKVEKAVQEESQMEIKQEEVEPEATSFKIGDRIETEDYFVTVKGIRKTSGAIAPKSGYTYLLVDVLVENKTSDEKTISSMLSSSVRDEEGVKYTITVGADNKGSLDGRLLPKDKLRGEVVFEIPKEAKGLRYYFETSLFGGKTIVVDLGI